MTEELRKKFQTTSVDSLGLGVILICREVEQSKMRNGLMLWTLLLLLAGATSPAMGDQGCSQGWERCDNRPLCIPSGCQEPSNQSPSMRCSEGMVYCSLTGACVATCDGGLELSDRNNPSTAQQPQPCPPAMAFCTATGRCVGPNECSTEGRSSDTYCPPGTHFCPSQGGCVVGECVFSASMGGFADISDQAEHCPPGTVFCLPEGRCSEAGGSCRFFLGRDGLGGPGQDGFQDCEPGQVFCLSSQRCTAPTHCGGAGPLEDTGRRGVTTCRFGEVFCAAAGRCLASSELCGGASGFPLTDASGFPRADAGGFPRADAGVSDVKRCNFGEVFCAAAGRCLASSELCGGAGGFPLADAGGSDAKSCNFGEVFCFSSGRCEQEGSCGKRPPETWSNSCPPGMVYCMASNQCVAQGKGCGDGSPQFDDDSFLAGAGAAPGAPGSPGKVCPPDTFFCPPTGQCASSCSERGGPAGVPDAPSVLPKGTVPQCPPRTPSAAPVTATTCLYSMQCPYTYDCCKDADSQHQHCVDAEGEVAPEDTTLACFTMKEEQYSTGIRCSQPQDCPASSVCCEGKCVSLGGTKPCPSTSLYCSLTSRCHLLDEACGKQCEPGLVYCIAQDECVKPNSCEFAAYTSGSAWTLPGPLLVPLQAASSIVETVTLQDVLGIESEIGLTVDDVSSHWGRWEFMGARGLEEIKKGDVVFMGQPIRFVPSVDGAIFGAAYLNLTESGTGISRLVSQLLAPAPPPLTLNIASPFLEVLEDETVLAPLSQLVDFNHNDPHYWAAWSNALAVREQLVSSNLLDFTDPSVAAFQDLLTHPNNAMLGPSGVESAQQAEVLLELRDEQETLLLIEYSTDEGKSWNIMPQNSLLRLPLESASDFADIFLKIIPTPNKSGRTRLLVSSEMTTPRMAEQRSQGGLDGTMNFPKRPKAGKPRSFGSMQEIVVEVQAVNDAPVPKQAANFRLVPTLSTETTNDGFPVSKLTEIFYFDPDEEAALGAVMLYAQDSDLGQWQYSDNAGVKWTDMSELTVFPLAQQPVLSGSYQGVVDLMQSLGSTACDMRNSVASLINNDQCMDMIRESADSGSTAPPATAPSLAGLQASHAQQLQAQYSGAANGSLQVTRPSSTISGLFLPATTLVRFAPNASVNGTWGKIQAMTQTRLVFSAWDASDVPVGMVTVSRRNVELLKCPLCGGDQSVSLEPAVVVAEWTDCNGRRLVEGSATSTTSTKDICGVCNGDGTSCIDCNGDINGTATFECRQCVGGKTGLTAQRDCAGSCYKGVSTTVCEMALSTVQMCDNQMGSTATKNKCGLCVLGNTGLDITAGEDQCDVCRGSDDCVGCDGVVNSKKVWHVCGPCVGPNDIVDNCTALGSVEPRMLDVAQIRNPATGRKQNLEVFSGLARLQANIADRQDVTIKADLAGVDATTHKITKCSLVDPSGKANSTVASSTIFRGNQVMAAFNKLTKGTWDLECLAIPRNSATSAALKKRTSRALNMDDEDVSQRGPPPEGPPPGGPPPGGPPPGGPRKGGRRKGGPPPDGSGGRRPPPPPGGPPPSGSPPPGAPQTRTGIIASAADVESDVVVLKSVSTRNTITIVDSTSLYLAVVGDTSNIMSGQESKIKLQLDTTDGLNKDSSCFLKYEPKQEGGKPLILELEVTELSTDDATLECLVPETAPAGDPIVGVALLPAVLGAMQAEDMSIPGKPIVIKGSAPRVVSSKLSPDGRKLIINFRSNIDTEADCDKVFSNGDILGSEYSCKIRGSKLIFTLGQDATVSAASELSWSGADGGVVQRAVGTETLPPVTGSITVTQPIVQDSTSFELVGDTQACNGSDVEIRARTVRGAQELNIVWNITFLADPPFYSRKQVLDIWDSIQKMKAGMNEDTTSNGKTLVLPGAMFLPGVEYVVVPQTSAADGSLINENQNMVVQQIPGDRTYRINVKGETSVTPGRRYRYKAQVEACLPEGDTENIGNTDLKYFWTLNGSSDAFQDVEGNTLWIPKDLLVGGSSYSLEVLVMEVGATARMGKGALSLETVSQGLSAVTSSDSMRVGAANSIRLDATASSDSDYMPGELQYRWSCTTDEGEGCFVNKDGKMQRIEVVLPEEDLTSPLLVIPESLLPTGKYIMTLTVSKDRREATRSTALEVVGGSLPSVYTRAAEMVVNPKKKITVRASFSSGSASTARWMSMEGPDYSYVSLVGVATSADLITFDDPSVMRPFSLVIPEPISINWLLDEAVYKFRLVVTNKEGLEGFADVVVRTNSPPSGGSLTVSPSSGEALVTGFEFSSPGWEDDSLDYPLSVTFGYQLSDGPEDIVWMTPIAADDPTMTFPLPAMSSSTKVTPYVRACDVHEACTQISADTLSVSLPSDVTAEALSALTDEITTSITSDAGVLLGLERGAGVLATLQVMDKDDQFALVKMVVENKVRNKITNLNGRLSGNSAAQATASTLLAGGLLLSNQVDVSVDVLLKLQDLNNRLLGELRGVPHDETAASQLMYYENNPGNPTPGDEIFFPKTDKDLQKARSGARGAERGDRTPPPQGYSEDTVRGGGRAKRDAEDVEVIPSYTAMTPDQVRNSIKMAEKILTALESQGAKSAEMDALVKNMDTFAAGLCLHLEQDETERLAEKYVGLSVLKSQLIKETDQLFAIVEDKTKNNFVKNSSYLVWGPILDQFKSWACGRTDPGTGDALQCYGACLATMQYRRLFAAPSTRDATPGKLRGNMVRSVILNPESGLMKEARPDDTAMEYSITLQNKGVPQDKRLKCFFWSGLTWSPDNCRTLGLTTLDGIHYQKCQCPLPGYVAVFQVDKPQPGDTDFVPTNTNDSDTTTEPPIAVYQIRDIKFIIQDNYTAVVGDYKVEFERNLTVQVAANLGVFQIQVHNLTVSPGSILVEFQLLKDTTNAATTRLAPQEDVETLYDQLLELINSGEFELSGLNSEALTVPPQGLDGSGPPTEPTAATANLLPIIIGSIVAGILLIGIVLIGIAIYCKNKKRMDKVSSLQGGGGTSMAATLPPTYRSIHFEQDLDGTAASLAKQRKPEYSDLDSSATYTDEDLYIERHSKSSASSQRTALRSSSGASVGLGSINEDEAPVPEPFTYRSPTQSALNRSGPIPAHIVEQIEAEKDLTPPKNPVLP